MSKVSAIHSARAILFDWGLIVASFALAIAVPHPLVWIVCFVLNARQQLALAILMHDGAHRRLFKSTFWNDVLCQYLNAAPLLFSMYSYQKLHLKHHREPLAADDPDLTLIGGYPISKKSFYRKLLRDAVGISYFKFIRYFIHMARKPRAAKSAENVSAVRETKESSSNKGMSVFGIVASILVMNGAMWAILFSIGHGWYYLFFWILPAVTALQVILRIRGVAEHAGYSVNEDQRLNSRTVIHPLQTAIFAPHGVNYHIEHHLYPSVPFFRLGELHRILMSRNAIPESNIFRGYHKVMADLLH